MRLRSLVPLILVLKQQQRLSKHLRPTYRQVFAMPQHRLTAFEMSEGPFLKYGIYWVYYREIKPASIVW